MCREMWGIVRRFLKMGMLKLQKEVTETSKPELESDETRRQRHQAAPKAIGFAARQEILKGDSISK